MFELPMRPRDLPKRLPDIRAFLIQPKWDGWYVVFRDGRAYTRTGEDITGWACWAGRKLPENAVGELLHRDGRQHVPTLALSAARLRVVLFDVPGPEPIEDRVAKLADIAQDHEFDYTTWLGVDSWAKANSTLAWMQTLQNVEGLVLKRRGSAWTPGEKHADWYRFKRPVAL